MDYTNNYDRAESLINKLDNIKSITVFSNTSTTLKRLKTVKAK